MSGLGIWYLLLEQEYSFSFTRSSDEIGHVLYVGTGALIIIIMHVLIGAATESADAVTREALLLRELQHRVKNHIQLVGAMLGVHARKSGSVHARSELLEARSINKIKAETIRKSSSKTSIAKAFRAFARKHKGSQMTEVAFLENVEHMVAPNGEAIALKLKNTNGATFETALAPDDFSRFVTHLLNIAQEAGSEMPTMPSGAAQLRVQPVLARRIGFAQGRDPTEALVGLEVGPLSLMFAVRVSTLRGLCNALVSQTLQVANPRKPN